MDQTITITVKEGHAHLWPLAITIEREMTEKAFLYQFTSQLKTGNLAS